MCRELSEQKPGSIGAESGSNIGVNGWIRFVGGWIALDR